VHICALACTHGKLTNVLKQDTPGVFKKKLSVELRQLIKHYLNLNVPPHEIVDKVRHLEFEKFRLQREILCPAEAQKRFLESEKSGDWYITRKDVLNLKVSANIFAFILTFQKPIEPFRLHHFLVHWFGV
jgi:hypothetical protein